MKIKVCGMRDAENIRAVEGLEPDFIGHIFYAGSPRYAGKTGVKTASSAVKKVGVFVDETRENIVKQIADHDLYAVQLHGHESPEFCRELKGRSIVIKAFGIGAGFDFSVLNAYADDVDFFLFDTKTQAHGGSGKTFDWTMLNTYKGETPFFLSGGIGPENLREALDITHPRFYGLDLNSRFELSPGIKDVEKLKAAFVEIRKTGNGR